MKTKVRIKFAMIFIWVLMMSTVVNAQVTVGSLDNPVKGALLDLKTSTPDANNVTSNKGGLILSRVRLVDRTTLQPFIGTGDTEWDATNGNKTRRDHIGLIVYNLTDNTSFHPGLYVWRGSKWEPLASGNDVIVLPAFKLQWQANATINLFNDVYKANFNPTSTTRYVSSRGAGQRVDFPDFKTNASDFYYVVTNYDSDSFEVNSITAEGVMTYSKKATAPAVMPASAFINVVLIKK